MRNRQKKWARYRERIQRLPESRFPAPKTNRTAATLNNDDTGRMSVSTNAISLATFGEKEKKILPYFEHLKHEKIMLMIKVGLFVVALVTMILIFFLYVR